MSQTKHKLLTSVRGRLLLFNLLVAIVTLMVSVVAVLGFLHASRIQEQMRQQTLDDMTDSINLASDTASVAIAAIRLTQVAGAPEYQEETKQLKKTQLAFKQSLQQLARSPLAQKNTQIVARIIRRGNTLQQSVSDILQNGQQHNLYRAALLSSLYQNQSYLHHIQRINSRLEDMQLDDQRLREMNSLITAAAQTPSPGAIIKQLNKIMTQLPSTVKSPMVASILSDFIIELNKLKPLAQQLEDSLLEISWQMYHIKALVEFLNKDIDRYVNEVKKISLLRTAQSHKELHSIITFIILFSLLAMFITGCAGWYIYRSLGSNLTSISRAMTQLAQGEGNIVMPALQRSDELGELARAFNIFARNTTSLKRTLQLLKEKSQLLETTFHSMRDGFALFDKQNTLVVWNLQYPLLLGLAPEDVFCGQHYQDLLHKVSCIPHYSQENIARVLPKPQELRLADHRVVELRFSPVSGQGMVNTVLDRTERKNLEEALLHSQKMKVVGQLTGGLAHDFNNLLSVIIGSLELVSHDLPDALRISRALKAAERGALLTQRLLAFSRKQALHPQSINIKGLLENLSELIRHSLPVTLTLEIEAQASAWPAWIDAGQLENAIINLIMNARDAMEGRHGTIKICTWNQRVTRTGGQKQDMVALEVIDQGCGMSPEIKAQAYEPFFTTKQTGSGSGLGLSMVYGFVRQSGGRVQIESSPGQGTTVRLQLPRAMRPAMEQHPPETLPNKQKTDQLALVLEDNSEVRQTLCEQLHQLGYFTLEAERGEQALQLLERSADICLFISDLMLPGDVTGVEVLQHARAHYPSLRVLLISGQDFQPMDKLSLSEFPFLRKPFTHGQLAQCLTAIECDANARHGEHK